MAKDNTHEVRAPKGARTITQDAKVHSVDGRKPISTRETSADATEKRRNVEFGRGGKNPDVGEQSADTARPGKTGKDAARGPGKLFVGGGRGRQHTPGANLANPARPGRTGVVKSTTEGMRDTHLFRR